MIILEDLPLPCPVNRMWRMSGHHMHLSKEANDKTRAIVAEIHQRLGGAPEPITAEVAVYMRWWRRELNRRCDVDAYIKGALDALTKAGVWADDNQVVMVQCELMPERRFPGLWSVTVDVLGADDA